MNKFKKLMSLITATTFLFTGSLQSGECTAQCTGCGYEESCRVPTYAPEIALSALAIAAIVILAVQNSNGSHSHH